jgi:hypothetical protein
MRAQRGELVSAASALALLGLMFAFAWYGVDGTPAPGSAHTVSSTENAWEALSVVRWVMLVTIVVTIGSLMLHFSQREHAAPTDSGRLILGLGAITSALLVYRVLIDLPSPAAVPDQKLGAVLGVLSALGVALGGWDLVVASRGHLASRRPSR